MKTTRNFYCIHMISARIAYRHVIQDTKNTLICINPKYFWYSVLSDDGMFRSKHVVTILYVGCNDKHFWLWVSVSRVIDKHLRTIFFGVCFWMEVLTYPPQTNIEICNSYYVMTWIPRKLQLNCEVCNFKCHISDDHILHTHCHENFKSTVPHNCSLKRKICCWHPPDPMCGNVLSG